MLIGLLLTPAIVLGHAELDTVTPKDKSTVQSPPTEIVMTFTEPVDPKKSSIKLVDAGGTVIAQGSSVDAGDAKTMRLALTPLHPATYTVRWTTASALDGDLDHGTTTFTVAAAASIAPSASPASSAASASAPASAGASVAPPSAAPTPSPSSAPTTPAASTSDAVIPVVIALIVLAALGLWLMRGRSRSGR